MTEDEWLTATDLESLLKWLERSKHPRSSRRKCQLLANAYVNRISERFADPQSECVRRFMDKVADSGLPQREMWLEWQPWWERSETIQVDHFRILRWAVGVSVSEPVYDFPSETHVAAVAGFVSELTASGESQFQLTLLRDIFGNPFRPVAFDAAWRTSTAVALARGMYESRDFGAMPILADALQDAGCDSDAVLTHCRDPQQVHVRGCWVVDLVLGKV